VELIGKRFTFVLWFSKIAWNIPSVSYFMQMILGGRFSHYNSYVVKNKKKKEEEEE